MKIELHNLLIISLWEEEYTSVLIWGKSLIIISKEGKPKSIKFPFSLKNSLNFSLNVKNQDTRQEIFPQTPKIVIMSPQSPLQTAESSSKLSHEDHDPHRNRERPRKKLSQKSTKRPRQNQVFSEAI